MTATSDKWDTRIPYRLGTDQFCEFEEDGSYVHMGDMVSCYLDTPFGEVEIGGELCAVCYGEDGFIDYVSVYVGGKERGFDCPNDGVFFRMEEDDAD